MFKTIKKEIETSVTEKKSKFICHIYHVESVEEAEEKLDEVRKKYHDARHNCYVYRIADGDISKASDDGEPSGTAGVPMLNILNGNNLSNVLVVVTRYFEEAEILVQTRGLEAECFVGYNEFEELKYHLKNRNIEIINAEYAEKIKVIVEGKEEDINKLLIEKISDRITLENIQILRKKYISVEEK